MSLWLHPALPGSNWRSRHCQPGLPDSVLPLAAAGAAAGASFLLIQNCSPPQAWRQRFTRKDQLLPRGHAGCCCCCCACLSNTACTGRQRITLRAAGAQRRRLPPARCAKPPPRRCRQPRRRTAPAAAPGGRAPQLPGAPSQRLGPNAARRRAPALARRPARGFGRRQRCKLIPGWGGQRGWQTSGG